MSKSQTPEGQILRSITDYLAAERIWFMRINTGAMSGSHNGKAWYVKFAKPGTADILAVYHPERVVECGPERMYVVWIEVKTPKGKQSEAQLMFEKEVRAEGHIYIVARSIEDVKAALET